MFLFISIGVSTFLFPLTKLGGDKNKIRNKNKT